MNCWFGAIACMLLRCFYGGPWYQCQTTRSAAAWSNSKHCHLPSLAIVWSDQGKRCAVGSNSPGRVFFQPHSTGPSHQMLLRKPSSRWISDLCCVLVYGLMSSRRRVRLLIWMFLFWTLITPSFRKRVLKVGVWARSRTRFRLIWHLRFMLYTWLVLGDCFPQLKIRHSWAVCWNHLIRCFPGNRRQDMQLIEQHRLDCMVSRVLKSRKKCRKGVKGR